MIEKEGFILTKKGFNPQDIISLGNMFLLGNGKYGYRGTLEEYQKDEMVAFNVLGLYDQYEDKWRESVNLPNPLFIKPIVNKESYSILDKQPLEHEISLDIRDACFARYTNFDKVEISSLRFLSSVEKDLIALEYRLKVKEDINLDLMFGLDLDIYDINGPHFKDKKVVVKDNRITFIGFTNEGKEVKTFTVYQSDEKMEYKDGFYHINKMAKKDETITLTIYSYVKEEKECHSYKNTFEDNLSGHIIAFSKKWDMAEVLIDDEQSQFDLLYSIYHLLILEDEDSECSIPARGVSGQTYKGAIFWDSEIFILPFFTLTNPKFARNIIKYRINTLEGAKKKARSFGYQGAFYAWESQDDGVERCSKYNVTDPITNQPIRTYFDEKQIHISADIALAIKRYYDFTLDESIFIEGGYEVIYECLKFYVSRATFRNNQYHFDDVIGPDEYHERVNDNAFTNYMVYENAKIAYELYDKYIYLTDKSLDKETIKKFMDKIYLPKPNEEGIIEQFDGYFKLEDKKPAEVLALRRNDKEYLGHLAMNTKTIKQADVITLLTILPREDLNDYLLANYKYYYPYTEHGSSLSASMYSLSASKLKIMGDAYHLFKKSASIDLGTEQKMYAGGIYIGGTHPASNAGAYLSVVLGFAGLTLIGDEIKAHPHLPDNIKGIKFKFIYRNKKFSIEIKKDNTYLIKEETL